MGVEGAEGFREFADRIADLEAEAPQIIDKALRRTAREVRDEVIDAIERQQTSKGGTFDSRTSPYEPGGTNESSTDTYHISDKDAWLIAPTSTDTIVVAPRPSVRKRAEYMNFGTPSHGPDGETPMYFQYNGVTIVLSETPVTDEEGEVIPLGERFDDEPVEVDGVDRTNYFFIGLERVKRRNVLRKELKRAFEEALIESGLFEF
jgi:hypothetical protein